MQKILLVTILTAALLACGSFEAAAEERVDVFPLLGISAEYIDNLFATATNPQWDALATAVGGGTLMWTDPSRRLKLDYLTDGQLYDKHPGSDQAFHDQYVGLADQERLFEATTLSLSDYFIKGAPVFSQALVGPQGVSSQLGATFLSQNYLNNSFDALLHHDFGKTFDINVDVHQNLFSASGSTTTTGYNQGGSITAYYLIVPQFGIGPGYDFEDFRFSNEPRQDNNQPSMAAFWAPNARIKITVASGPILISSASGTKTDFGYSLTSTYVGERVKVTIGSGRAPTLNSGFGGAGINQSAGGTVSYLLGVRTTTFATVYYSDTSGSGISTQVLTYGVGIQQQLTRTISIYGSYIGYQTTIPGSSSATTNAIIVGLKFAGMPWRWVW